MLDQLLSALSYAGETLDKPGAAVRGALAGRPDQLLNLVPFSDTLGITDPSQRVSGRDLLQQYGMLGENTPGLDWGDAAGFVAEEVLDPTNWIPGGFLAKRAIRATGELPALTRLFGKTAPAVWSDDVAGMAARFADQEVDDIGADWLFDQRRLQAIPPAYQFKESGTTFAPEDVRDMLSEYNRAEYARRYGGAGTPVEPAELEPLYRALHSRRLGRYRDWLGKNAVLDEAGNPLKLYHGTGEVFDEFSADRFGKGSGGDLVGKGVYLSNNPEISSDYAMAALRRRRLLEGDPPVNVRMHHAIGPVADFITPGGLETAGLEIEKKFPRKGVNADIMRERNVVRDYQTDLGEAVDIAWQDYDGEPLREVSLQAMNHISDMLDMYSTIGGVPKHGIEYAREIKSLLDESQSFSEVLPSYTGIKHPGGLMGGGTLYDAFVMFDPKNVVPANPDPRMLQLLAERFRDPQGNLPFSILAALTGGAGAAAYRAGGQQDVY